MPAIASLRALVVGSGNCTPVAGAAAKPQRITFVNAQSFLRGETIDTGGYRYTVNFGQGTEWTMNEPQNGSGSAGSFKRTDPSASRARGTDAFQKWVPRARHFVYVAYQDAAGSPDFFTYVDTIYPINGLHPYTRDRYSGYSWLAQDQPANVTAHPVADLANRVAALDALPPVLSR